MSGWFNINDGLSSIKGQLTTFANNVLAEDEGIFKLIPYLNITLSSILISLFKRKQFDKVQKKKPSA